MALGKRDSSTTYETIFTDRDVIKAAHTVLPMHYIPSCYNVWSIRVDLE
jgi:hypothetical protein